MGDHVRVQFLVPDIYFGMEPTSHPRPAQPSIPQGSVNEYQLRLGRQRQVWFIPLADVCGEISWEHVPYLITLEVCSRRRAMQIHVYFYLYLCQLSVRPLTICPLSFCLCLSVNLWCYISVPRGGILMKLATNIHHVCLHCWKVLSVRGQRSRSRPDWMLWWQRHAFQLASCLKYA